MKLQSIRLTEDQVQGLQWEVIERTEDYIRSRAVFGMKPDGTPVYAYQTAPVGSKEYLESLQQERNDNEGRRWSEGMGSDANGNLPMVKVASIPMNIWARDLAPRAADQDYKKWWLDREENAPFRVRKGKL